MIFRRSLDASASFREKKDQKLYQAVMEVIARANMDVIKGEWDMCQAWKELAAEMIVDEIQRTVEIEVEKAEKDALEKGRENNTFV